MRNFNNIPKKDYDNCVYKKTPDNNKSICPIDNSSIFFNSNCNVDNFDLSTKFWKQLSLNGDIAIEHNKPLIKEIDSINAKVEIIHQKVLKAPTIMEDEDFEELTGGRRIIKVYGLICFSINYVALLKEEEVYILNDKIPFATTIDLPEKDNEDNDMIDFEYIVSACIEDIHINSIIDRNINLTATFILSAAKSFNKDEFCIAENYINDSSMNCKDVNQCINCDDINQIVFKGIFPQDKIEDILEDDEDEYKKYRKRFNSIEILDLPKRNPNIIKILSVTTDIKILCQRVSKTPMIDKTNLENKKFTGTILLINFMLYQNIKYSSNTSCESIHFAKFEIPGSVYITVPNTTLTSDKFKISYYIDDIYACILNERQIFKSVSVIFHAKPLRCPEVNGNN